MSNDPFCPRHGRASRPIEIPGLRCDCATPSAPPSRVVKLWAQRWEEFERGWGSRPDGYTLHRTRDDIASFLQEIRTREAEQYRGAVPDEYSAPRGEPFQIEVDDADLIIRVYAAPHGIWGPGRTPDAVKAKS